MAPVADLHGGLEGRFFLAVTLTGAPAWLRIASGIASTVSSGTAFGTTSGILPARWALLCASLQPSLRPLPNMQLEGHGMVTEPSASKPRLPTLESPSVWNERRVMPLPIKKLGGHLIQQGSSAALGGSSVTLVLVLMDTESVLRRGRPA